MNWIAQIANDYAPLAPWGLLTAVLGWFMTQFAKLPGEIKSLAHRIDGLTRALLVDMVERDSIGIHTKNYARQEIAKIDARNREEN